MEERDVRTVNEHIQNIFAEGELTPDSVIRNFRITAADGKSYATGHYRLEMILAVGYRVKSLRGTQFRQVPVIEEPIPRRRRGMGSFGAKP